jgi:ribonuclease HII
MVLAAVVLDTRAAASLSRRGLRDSKTFGAGDKGRAARAELAALVRAKASFWTVEVVDVSEVDRRVSRGELNVLEREVAQRMITRAPAVDRIVADGKRLFAELQNTHAHLEAVDKGESKHASVAAASVLAKHRRDCIFECISSRYRPLFGDIRGGGYGNAATREFLRAYAERWGRLPPEARRSWPYPYLGDILGADFDPYGDCPNERAGQMKLAL